MRHAAFVVTDTEAIAITVTRAHLTNICCRFVFCTKLEETKITTLQMQSESENSGTPD